MPAPTPQLSVDAVVSEVRASCFAASVPGGVGIELEAFPVHRADPSAFVEHQRVRDSLDAVGPLPGGSRLTFEPGGQLELSTLVAPTIGAACTALDLDLAAVRGALGTHEMGLLALGVDPIRAGCRVVDAARYRAMEAYFDAQGPEGRQMMTGTAALQVNLEAGADLEERSARWQLANALGPVLLAAFANSPLRHGRPTGRRSSRGRVWAGIDPSRTRRPATSGDPIAAWTDYALDARVMMICLDPDHAVPLGEALTFRQWLTGGHRLGYPTIEDLHQHLSTLFPPVRAKRWLEVRVIDALDDPWWRVAVAVTTALLDDPTAAAVAAEATATTATLWEEAATDALTHHALGDAAAACFEAAVDAFDRLSVDDTTCQAAAAYRTRFIDRRRCPADEVLDRWAQDGPTSLLPDARTAAVDPGRLVYR